MGKTEEIEEAQIEKDNPKEVDKPKEQFFINERGAVYPVNKKLYDLWHRIKPII